MQKGVLIILHKKTAKIECNTLHKKAKDKRYFLFYFSMLTYKDHIKNYKTKNTLTQSAVILADLLKLFKTQKTKNTTQLEQK